MASPYVNLNHTGLKTKDYTNSVYTLSIDQKLDMITKGLKLNVQGAYTSKEWFDETRKVVPELWYYDHRDANGNLAGTRQSVAQTVQYSKYQDLYRKYYHDLESSVC